jgi:preprotein translocase subunit SecG
MLNFFFYLTMVLFLVVCVFLILLVLIQKGRGGGLASAFGGAGVQHRVRLEDRRRAHLATSVVFGIFLVLAIAMNLLGQHTCTNGRTGLAGGSQRRANARRMSRKRPARACPDRRPTGGCRIRACATSKCRPPRAARCPRRTARHPRRRRSPRRPATQPTTAPQ